MPAYCFIKGCNSTRYRSKKITKQTDETLSFFSFPNKEEIYQEWVKAISVLNNQKISVITKNSKVCQKHFKSECFQKKIGFSKVRLIPNSVPSIFPKTIEESDSKRNIYSLNMNDTPSISINLIAHNSNSRECTVAPILRMPKCKEKLIREKLQTLTPKRLLAYVLKLRKVICRKNVIIKRLRVEGTRQQKKIECLKELLIDLK